MATQATTEEQLTKESVYRAVFGEDGTSLNISVLSAVLEGYLSVYYQMCTLVLVQMWLIGGRRDGENLYTIRLGGRGMDAKETTDTGELFRHLGEYADHAAEAGLNTQLQISFAG